MAVADEAWAGNLWGWGLGLFGVLLTTLTAIAWRSKADKSEIAALRLEMANMGAKHQEELTKVVIETNEDREHDREATDKQARENRDFGERRITELMNTFRGMMQDERKAMMEWDATNDELRDRVLAERITGMQAQLVQLSIGQEKILGMIEKERDRRIE